MGKITNYLLLSIGIIFIFQLMVPGLTEAFYFVPAVAFSQPWRFLTSMFLHDPTDIFHILFNAFALFMFGAILETRISSKDYLLIYFGAGLFGGLCYYATYLVGIIPSIPALGASAAIYGIMAAVAMLMPEVRVFFLVFPMSIRQAAIIWVIIEFLGTFDPTSGIASAAHLGGLFFGFMYAWLVMKGSISKPVATQAIYGHEVA